jgi:hypothetical protein
VAAKLSGSFDSIEDREHAYTSPRIRECDKDSEGFVGSVSRIVLQAEAVLKAADEAKAAKAYIVKYGKADPTVAWARAVEEKALATAGVCGFTRHTILSQAGAPGSKVPELHLPVSGVVEVWFDDEAALLAAAQSLADGGALYAARDYRLI